ncbi:hypothetical protein CLSAB_19240 [Clostridium saccharobutylicum]|uniref:hypothetical protein n=1 Tax=Clostridium saccharobutylicum TaxID=169679 RepID=UPI00098CCB92|nr:hypothetical protein [Clostridium saccharobutylicum]OOM17204.1 hypothetical protein CLSAB_19240 [Clostridium saccharobutylicum]
MSNNYKKELNRFRKLYLKGDKNSRGFYMSEMEKIFKIPMLNDEEFNRNNKEVIELYRKFADWLFN